MAVLEVFLRTSQTPSINDNKNPKMGNIHVAKPRVIPRNQCYAEMFIPWLNATYFLYSYPLYWILGQCFNKQYALSQFQATKKYQNC